MTNHKTTANSRLRQDYIRLKKDPVPFISAEPLPSDILEWHYLIKGPEDSPYYGGYYHGTLLFTKDFPFKPPTIYMLTPNGRFKTNKRLCLSISDFHPDTWNPAWSIATILTGLLSFMLETTPTLGSIETSTQEKRKYARQSMEFNLKDETFCELFPDIVEEINEKLTKLKEQQNLNNNNATTNNNKPLENNLCDNLNNNLTNPNSFCYSLMTNAIVLICFAIFALIVHYVFKSINVE